jgi:hypothetical protein
MPEDRIAKRNRGNASGLWLLAALALLAGLLVLAAMLKTSAERQHARLEAEAAAPASGEKSSTGSLAGISARPLPLE